MIYLNYLFAIKKIPVDLGICSYAQRIRIEEGWVWWTYKEQVPGDHRWHKFNWDIYRDPRPKGYTTSHD